MDKPTREQPIRVPDARTIRRELAQIERRAQVLRGLLRIAELEESNRARQAAEEGEPCPK